LTVYSILPPPATIPRFLTGDPEERVAAAIAELPTENADAVAAYLAAVGVRGVRSSAEDCPIARYVRLRARHAVWVAVGEIYSRTGGFGTLPAAVVDFYRRFDHGEYPDLMITPREALSPMEPRS